MAIALYKDTYSKEFIVTSPESVMQSIVSGTYKQMCEYLLTLGHKEYKTEKQKLPAVTWSGLFKDGTRLINTLQSYSKLVVIDVDKLEPSAIDVLKKQLSEDEYIRYCFVSPSQRGIKFIIEVNTTQEHHRAAFLHLQNHFETKYLIKIDPSGKDVSRLCYVSYDPFAIIKQKSKVFEVDLKYGDIVNEHALSGSFVANDNLSRSFNICKLWVERKKTFQEGERNVYIHALACAMNRVGVKMDDTISIISQNYDTPDQRWHQSVRSAYFHNQAEFGSKEIKDIGSSEFVAPPYIANFTDDVAANDLMSITAVLYHHKVPNVNIIDVVGKIGKYYHSQGYIDLNRASLPELMNKSILALNNNIASNAEKASLEYIAAEDMALELMKYGANANAITTGLPMFDDQMMGGLQLGNFYGFVGMGETFKSILAEYICFINAINGIPCLFLNGEMSRGQFFERLIFLAWGINVPEEMRKGTINKDNVADFVRQIKEVTKNNIFVVNGSGFTKESILATIELIKLKNDKHIKLVVSDGMSQWSWGSKDEINATITNSFFGKDLAKEAHGGEGVAHIGLMHVSGEIKKWYRNTGDYVRGKHKVLANFDAYFCTSRLIDPGTNELVNEDDVIFIKKKFYLRYVDKRSQAGVVNAIINIGDRLKLEVEGTDPNSYEVKINKKKPQY